MEPVDPGIVSGYQLLVSLCRKSAQEGDLASAAGYAKRACEQFRFVEPAGFNIIDDLSEYFDMLDEQPYKAPGDLIERRLNVYWEKFRRGDGHG